MADIYPHGHAPPTEIRWLRLLSVKEPRAVVSGVPGRTLSKLAVEERDVTDPQTNDGASKSPFNTTSAARIKDWPRLLNRDGITPGLASECCGRVGNGPRQRDRSLMRWCLPCAVKRIEELEGQPGVHY